MADAPFHLLAELGPHSSDVRAVTTLSTPDGPLVATGSRDATIALWRIAPDGSVSRVQLLEGHKHFVNALAEIPMPSGQSCLASGSSDKSIRIWDVSQGKCLKVLESAHDDAICSLVATQARPGLVCSSSWDSATKLWQLVEPTGEEDQISIEAIAVLRGHTASVLSVLWSGDGGSIVTASADKSIKIWSVADGTTVETVTGHTDVVRDLSVGPDNTIVSVANDGSLRTWELVPTKPAVCRDISSDIHDGSFVYSVRARPDLYEEDKWTVFTGGEDNSLRIWSMAPSTPGMRPLQTIVHPGTVWCVSFLEKDCVVTGCSDGKARVFTADPAKKGEEGLQEAFEKEVAGREVSTKVIGGVELDKLQAADKALNVPGTQEGQTKIVRTGANAEVHMWSASEFRWKKIGDVVDGRDEAQGQKFDYIFSVEVGKEGPKSQLGYNRGEDPYFAAQRFLETENLSPEYLDQIVDFIQKQVGPEVLQQVRKPTASDPYTGEGRYIPGAAQSRDPVNNVGSPLTEERYRPGGLPGNERISKPVAKHVPSLHGFTLFQTTEQGERMKQKLLEFNKSLLEQSSSAAVSEPMLISVFSKALSARSTLEPAEADCLRTILSWPNEKVFPALDLARIVISQEPGSKLLDGSSGDKLVQDLCVRLSEATVPFAVIVLSLRFFANLFGTSEGSSVLQRHGSQILEACFAFGNHDNRKARETLSALIENYALRLYSSSAPAKMRAPLLMNIVQLIQGGEEDESVLYHLSVALGTLMAGDRESALKAVELGAAAAASNVAPRSARLKECALEIAQLIP